MTGVIGLKRIIRFFKKALIYFNIYRNDLKRQNAEYEKIIGIGKPILRKIVEEFETLEATPPSLCVLVNDDSMVYIKVMGMQIVVGLYAISETKGALITYRANTWSDDWKNYTIPIDGSIRYDKLGNLKIGTEPLTDPDGYGLGILEHLIQIGKPNL